MPAKPTPPTSSDHAGNHTTTSTARQLARLGLWLGGLALAGLLSILMVVAIALAVAFPNLPDISELSDYRPKLPLRVYAAGGELIGEFGEERRNLTPIKDIPKVMTDAVLAIEDARFFQHGGVDYLGVIRAGLANLGRVKSQGASTITMQVARNVYLSSEKTFTRKLYEILLTFKLEHLLTKEQILEIYMNQIFLGNRAYGFAAAAETYFGKPLKDISVAEAAMLAGLPKAPSAYNPISNPKRARSRQLYIIERMLENGFITEAQAVAAKKEELRLRPAQQNGRIHAEFVAETVRQLMYAQYGDAIYTRGLNVHTTLRAADQEVAYLALRRGIMDYERRQIYRGPEKFVTLPGKPQELEDAIDDALDSHPDNGDLMAAVVLEADPKKIVAVRQNGESIEITGEGLRPAQSGLSAKAPPHIKIRRGAVIRIAKTPKDTWEITQLPEVEGAFVALDPRDGSIKALVGGFDFVKNKFNHVTQAWRQPGSSMKPFVYSAALEKGFTPISVLPDEPISVSAEETGSQAWEPKNYDGKYDGPMTLRTALAKSKNMVSIRLIRAIDPRYAQDYATRFGFDADKNPPYLTLALGAGNVTPWQHLSAYSVFANGGYKIEPYLVQKILGPDDRVLAETTPPLAGDESLRIIDERNAWLMDSMLKGVVRQGTATRAAHALKRTDLAGKTGTTNDYVDAWFCGYQPAMVGVAWIGFDQPKRLGSGETGGSAALPIWIGYMETALKGVPEMHRAVPDGLTQVDSRDPQSGAPIRDHVYGEYAERTASFAPLEIIGVQPPAPVENAQIRSITPDRRVPMPATPGVGGAPGAPTSPAATQHPPAR